MRRTAARPGGRRGRWGQALDGLLRRYEPLAWQSIVTGFGCPLILEVLLADGSVFHPGRELAVHVCVVTFVGFAVLAIVRRRVGPTVLLVQCLQALTMVVVIGTSTDHLGVVAACLVTLGLVLVSAAAHLPPPRVLLLTLLSGAAVAGLLLGHGYSGPPLWLTVVAVTMLAGVPAGVLLAFRTRLQEALDDAERVSRTDALTGLLNRHGLSTAARAVVDLAARQGRLVGTLLVDVDHFKQVNDTFGHRAGDEVLRLVATTVGAASRPQDVVARFGGEELCVVLVVEHGDELYGVGERLRAAVEALPARPSVTVSVGGAAAAPPGPDQDVDDFVLRLVDRADAALYAVKRSGRNAVRVHASTRAATVTG